MELGRYPVEAVVVGGQSSHQLARSLEDMSDSGTGGQLLEAFGEVAATVHRAAARSLACDIDRAVPAAA